VLKRYSRVRGKNNITTTLVLVNYRYVQEVFLLFYQYKYQVPVPQGIYNDDSIIFSHNNLGGLIACTNKYEQVLGLFQKTINYILATSSIIIDCSVVYEQRSLNVALSTSTAGCIYNFFAFVHYEYYL
jgi:hypothetical protein